MLIETSRFGTIEVSEDLLITFRDGLLGFPECRRFAVIETHPDAAFFWLQSVDEPALAFVVCDPRLFVADYTVPVRQEDVASLALADLADCQVWAIVNKADDHFTANLAGPLVVGVTSRLGRQMVLSEKRYSTRHTLFRSRAAARRVG